MQIPQLMHEQYLQAKEIIENSDDIKIYSHIDCDGICSGAILSTILDRQNKEHDIEFVNLDVLDDIELDHDLTIFSDLGSGQNITGKAKKGQKIIVLDHHPPLRDLDYKNDKDYTYLEINPMHHGIDGSYYVCGGGLCYFLAKEFGYTDLSWIGVLSAIGDMQNTKTGHFEGLNKIIQQDAIDGGYLGVIKSDINIYGRNTRPLFVALSYFSDVRLPITNNTTETMAILEELEIDEKHNRKTLNELTMEEKARLYQRLVEMISKVVPGRYVRYVPQLIIGDSYTFLKEDEHSFLRDGSEFSTAMNACGRNHEEKIAMEVLKGDRFESLDELEAVSLDHRRNLAQAIAKVAEGDETNIVEMDNLQYFDGDGIKPEIVGTITGMILGYCDWKKPIIGFTQTDSDGIKVSLRCSRLLSYDGIHFGNIIRKIAGEVGGTGGGHAMACGAYIPIDKKSDFLERFNNELEGKITN
ncbi:single-stranded DNA-binding protein [Methanobrevibacter sp. YE315]|uniref:single-stranded-DNA-specific exonuclease RecJ n=1 Tax=Methanobrevibacter sp. YE315 TaxID=1609968 RepID=UPI000764E79C|nr:single-stranded-DNA-specific exonuclease RecJ [Methanobrevibacter sp. YE315]AMD17773.1 single-stranded DNA-binding protein [Methanobrevibacter sp. YE315]